jgi:outer membrane protein OmpA-like peptidoglycan-associated protein
MKNLFCHLRTPLVIAIVSILALGCASTKKAPDGAIAARNSLTELQANPQLAHRAPVAIDSAEIAVAKAEIPQKDKALSNHLVIMAQREVDIAWAQAQTRLLEDQRKGLDDKQDAERLNSRTREADRAHEDNAQLRAEADMVNDVNTQLRAEADAAKQASDELKRQILELNAKATDRGLVITLGDMLFETGKSQLKGNAADNLIKLSTFLKSYPDRTLIIEGHTDNVGSDDSNMSLSQRRADSVRSYLLSQGIASSRLTTLGKGEGSPIASNDSVSGRQLNRRVEVIIVNPVMAAQ